MIEITADLVKCILLGYLHKHCQGAAAARTQERIARDLRALGLNVTSRSVRDDLGALVEAGWPAGTTCGQPPGAFLCVSRSDLRIAYRNLYVRFQAQSRRCDRFRSMAREILNGQRRLDFGEAREAFADIECAPLLAPASLPARHGRPQPARNAVQV